MLKSIKDKYRIRFGQTHNYADIQDNTFCQALDELNEYLTKRCKDQNFAFHQELEAKDREIQELKDTLAKDKVASINFGLTQENKELREQLEKGCCRDDDMCQILQENIAIKAELQRLQSLYAHTANQLSIVQGELQEAKKFIGGQSYSTGTQEGE